MNIQQVINGEHLTNYPTFHVMKDCGVLCNRCIMNEENAAILLDASRNKGSDAQWEYAATGINYEDTGLYCDHCDKRIASAYADDELSEEDQEDCVW